MEGPRRPHHHCLGRSFLHMQTKLPLSPQLFCVLFTEFFAANFADCRSSFSAVESTARTIEKSFTLNGSFAVERRKLKRHRWYRVQRLVSGHKVSFWLPSLCVFYCDFAAKALPAEIFICNQQVLLRPGSPDWWSFLRCLAKGWCGLKVVCTKVKDPTITQNQELSTIFGEMLMATAGRDEDM